MLYQIYAQISRSNYSVRKCPLRLFIINRTWTFIFIVISLFFFAVSLFDLVEHDSTALRKPATEYETRRSTADKNVSRGSNSEKKTNQSS